MREATRRDDSGKESRNSRDEEKGKEGIKHRGVTRMVSPQNLHRSRQRKKALRNALKAEFVSNLKF